VSLVDLLPTLLDLADGAAPDPAEPLDGRSLAPLLQGDAAGWPDTVFGEYMGEGAVGPCLMIRSGRHKYVFGATDPPQLFDLAADPGELANLAGKPEHAEMERWFESEIRARWDVAALKRQVIASQRRRRLVDRALGEGRPSPWDFQPGQDAARQYVRRHAALGDLERRARLPFREAPPDRGDGRQARKPGPTSHQRGVTIPPGDPHEP
jgi:choline-sulfatase